MKYVLIGLLKIYRLVISPLYGNVCRYYPSCSAYALRAVEFHGAVKGSWLAARGFCDVIRGRRVGTILYGEPLNSTRKCGSGQQYRHNGARIALTQPGCGRDNRERPHGHRPHGKQRWWHKHEV